MHPAIKDAPPILDRILDLRCDYICENPDLPTELHLTKEAEVELYKWMLESFDENTDEGIILRHYGMRAWDRLIGMKTIWDADFVRIE